MNSASRPSAAWTPRGLPAHPLPDGVHPDTHRKYDPQASRSRRRYVLLHFAVMLVGEARRIRPTQHIAKDILRASRLPLLPSDERHVAEDLKKIRKGKALSPVILIQGDLTRGRPPIIADGYHRMCAVYSIDEDALIPCKIV